MLSREQANATLERPYWRQKAQAWLPRKEPSRPPPRAPQCGPLSCVDSPNVCCHRSQLHDLRQPSAPRITHWRGVRAPATLLSGGPCPPPLWTLHLEVLGLLPMLLLAFSSCWKPLGDGTTSSVSLMTPRKLFLWAPPTSSLRRTLSGLSPVPPSTGPLVWGLSLLMVASRLWSRTLAGLHQPCTIATAASKLRLMVPTENPNPRLNFQLDGSASKLWGDSDPVCHELSKLCVSQPALSLVSPVLINGSTTHLVTQKLGIPLDSPTSIITVAVLHPAQHLSCSFQTHHGSGPEMGASLDHFLSFSPEVHLSSSIFIPILQMRTPRFREVKKSAPRHTNGK